MHDAAHRGEGRDLQHIGIVEIEHALVAILVQQRIEHGAGLRPVFGEHVTLLDVLGPLTAGKRLPIKGDVADQIERVEVLAEFIGDGIERQALGLQFLDNRLLALGGFPAPEEIVEAGKTLFQRRPGEVAQGFGDELAVLVEIFDALGQDAGADAIDVDLADRVTGRQCQARLIDHRFVVAGFRRDRVVAVQRVVGRRDRITSTGFINLHRVAVEIRVGEVAGGAAKIDQREEELLAVLMNAGAAPDDLLELGHRAHSAIEHDQPAGLRINTSREQPRSRHQHGIFRFRVDEIAELVLAFLVAAGDAHDVTLVFRDQIGVLVDECLAHTRRVLLIDAEHDRLLEAVAAFLQELGDFLRGQHRAVVEHDMPVEILRVVDAVLDLVAVAIELAEFGAIAFHIAIDVDLDDLVGREKAVADALFQGIGENRFAEIFRVGDIFGFLRRGGEADLRRAGKVVEDFPPCRILGRAATMAFVDHDQVKETGRKCLVELLPFLRASDRLIEAEIDLESGVDAPPVIERQRQIDGGAVRSLDGPGVGG